jgi:hypothetical protein
MIADVFRRPCICYIFFSEYVRRAAFHCLIVTMICVVFGEGLHFCTVG